MRPKKVILLVGADELLGDTAMRLKLWGYAVEECSDPEKALDWLRQRQFRLVILLGTVDPKQWSRIEQYVFTMLDFQLHRGDQLRIFDPAGFLPHGIATGVQRFYAVGNVWESLRESVRLTTRRPRGAWKVDPKYRVAERVA